MKSLWGRLYACIAEVRDAAGHASVTTTSVYTYVATDDDGEIGVYHCLCRFGHLVRLFFATLDYQTCMTRPGQ